MIMKLGVMGSGLGDLGWEKALLACQRLKLDAIEIPCGGYPGDKLIDPNAVLADAGMQRKIKDDVASHGLVISALACHGNPVHPDGDLARSHEEIQDVAVRLAPKLGVNVVITFSGCPGGAAGDRMPNWAVASWPTEYPRILEYQWNDVLIPYWQRKSAEAVNEGVKIALEPHPGFCVYNPETLLRLRRMTGGLIGANFDPSHFFWQGIDPVEAVRLLGDAHAIYHVHAKDTAMDAHNTRINGVLDTRPQGDLSHRSWTFRSCGYGHGDEFWKPFVSMLQCKGYDGILSIEHEDSLMSVSEGLSKAAEYLRGVLIRDSRDAGWASLS
jgi:sugar phosphate isomerase/epimerase